MPVIEITALRKNSAKQDELTTFCSKTDESTKEMPTQMDKADRNFPEEPLGRNHTQLYVQGAHRCCLEAGTSPDQVDLHYCVDLSRLGQYRSSGGYLRHSHS